ncbi:hypothetical protein M0804_001523 [Polistes exclamans]|nr:hypothetical protein M0804_001523 [Polistes exclamans]
MFPSGYGVETLNHQKGIHKCNTLDKFLVTLGCGTVEVFIARNGAARLIQTGQRIHSAFVLKQNSIKYSDFSLAVSRFTKLHHHPTLDPRVLTFLKVFRDQSGLDPSTIP